MIKLLLQLAQQLLPLLNKQKGNQEVSLPPKYKPITLTEYITASGRYPERLKSKEWVPAFEDNAKVLLQKVNGLLEKIGVLNADVTSGFRPTEVNGKISNAARASAHKSGRAIDILDDKEQTLAAKITNELLEEFDLYMEDERYTKKTSNWVHLQTRKASKRRFIP